MSEPTVPAAAPAEVVPPAVAPAATQNNAEVVSQLQKEVADLKAAMNAANAKARVATKQPVQEAPPKQTIEQPTLERQAEELRTLKATIFGQAKNAAILAAAAGVTGEKAEHLRKYVTSVYGENVEVADDMQVYYREGETRTPIKNWIQAFLQTDEGGMFVPAKPAASTEGLKPTTPGAIKSSDEIFGNLTHDELMKDPKRLREALKADPARVERLRLEADRERQKRKHK